MANSYGIPTTVEQRLRARDTCCVYCGKPYAPTPCTDRPTIEHLDERPPFRWQQGLTEAGFAICCWSCNASRGKRSLLDWFGTSYCVARGITPATVAEPVRRYLHTHGLAP